ncbi:MAG: type III restriction endonuclease subunit R [Thaumarchaeota archaeon S13]|nr:MAG: type III restriction endonuclease subunit R [Thaumarchaeota archaeon S13]
MNTIEIEPIKNLIICDPYKMPDKHWRYNREKLRFDLISTRRPAGFLKATPDSKAFDDPGEFVKLDNVDTIREQVNKWRDGGYQNVTGITQQLLKFWHKRSKNDKKLFFCQLEAIETIIWLTESPDSEKLGIQIGSDGGDFVRWCTKMATGTGKTIVMAMLIAWQVLNKTTYPNDTRFTKNVLIVAPGLTVKKRLEVLKPEHQENYYDEFRIVPMSMWKNLQKARIAIHNWHTLIPIEDKPYDVVKKGPESDNKFAKRILGFDSDNVMVINDEAHHAWRKKSIGVNLKNNDTKWIDGLDRIHRVRNIIRCYDFSATPFIPTGKSVSEEMLFGWIISDFSLNDAIESGLTKTPKIAIRDDSGKFDKNFKSRFYHMYVDPEVKPDLNRKARAEEKLPDLVRIAYMLLGKDWLDTKKVWDDHNKNTVNAIPPVMVTVCNQTNTSARIEHFFNQNKLGLSELSGSEYMLRIDSSKLREAEQNTEYDPRSHNKSETLRQKVNSVGKSGTLGEQIRNVIAVQMITEGWDARNVTHIMGLRAFSSQLLCEQTVGRGLRRMSYDVNPDTGLFEPEYVNIFGVPFTFLPHEGGIGRSPKPPRPTSLIEPDPKKDKHEISWPNIDRINLTYSPVLSVDWKKIDDLKLKTSKISTTVGMAQVLAGKPHVDKMSTIDLCELNKTLRMQQIIFLASKDIYADMQSHWIGNRNFLIAQIIKLTEQFIETDKIKVSGATKDDKLRIKMTILFNMQSVVRHVCAAINAKNIEQRQLMLNLQSPIKSTSLMRPWHTKRLTEYAVKNHISLAVYDYSWELATGHELERNEHVESWVKNDHIGFVIPYSYNGSLHEYYPDFLIRLTNNTNLILEVKGKDNEQNKTKLKFLKEWVDAVNLNGEFGAWAYDVAYHHTEVRNILEKHSKHKLTYNIVAKCPACGSIAKNHQNIYAVFGYRNVGGVLRPQSWCRKCRNKS